MSTVMRTKFFECKQFYRKTPGGDATSWQLLPENSGLPVDKQLNNWLEQTQYQLVGLSAPGIQHFWLDEAHELKCLVVGMIATYVESPIPVNTDIAPPNFGGPAGAYNDRRNNTTFQPPAAGIPGPNPAVNIRRPAAAFTNPPR